MILEFYNASDWLEALRHRYSIEKTRMNSSKEAFTIMYLPFFPQEKCSLLIGRYDRTRGYGVVICRRERDISVEYEKRYIKLQ